MNFAVHPFAVRAVRLERAAEVAHAANRGGDCCPKEASDELRTYDVKARHSENPSVLDRPSVIMAGRTGVIWRKAPLPPSFATGSNTSHVP